MTLRELNKYRPAKTGIRVGVHNFDHKENRVLLSLFGSNYSPIPQDSITDADINEELGRMEKRLISDRIRNDKEKKWDFAKNSSFLVREIPTMFLPSMQGQYDCVNSKATNIKDKWIPKEEFKDVQQYYEKMKKEFDGKYKVQCEEERKIRDKKFVRIKTGEIITA